MSHSNHVAIFRYEYVEVVNNIRSLPALTPPASGGYVCPPKLPSTATFADPSDLDFTAHRQTTRPNDRLARL